MTRDELLERIKDAMRAKDKVSLSILRQVNQMAKQIEVDERREVTEADLTAAVKKLMKVTSEEIDSLSKVDGDAHAERIAMLRSQEQTLGSLLPAQLEGDELQATIDSIIETEGLSSRRDMGRLMGALQARTDGNFDKPAAAAYAQGRLG